MNDLISIIVPIYNVEKYLHKCVDSIISQTYENLEIILVDDGSPDNCGKICDEYAKKDSRIKVIHKENGGLSDARNAGIDVAKGEYLLFIDSDDYISPKLVETLCKMITMDASDMAVSSLCYVDEEGNDITGNRARWMVLKDAEYDAEQYMSIALSGFVGTVAKLYRKKLFDNIRFPVGKLHEDVFVAYKIIGKCKKISTTSKQMYYYLKNPDSIVNSEYTIRRLDAVEAYINATTYCLQKEYIEAAKVCMELAISLLKEGYKNLEISVAEHRSRLKILKKNLKDIYFTKMFCKMFWKNNIYNTTFFIHPKLNGILIKSIKIFKTIFH